MRNIVNASKNLDKRTMINYIVAPSRDIKTADAINVAGWIIAADDDDKRVLVIYDGENYYGTISPTFISAFETIVDIMGCDIVGECVNVTRSTSRNGRLFLSCTLA